VRQARFALLETQSANGMTTDATRDVMITVALKRGRSSTVACAIRPPTSPIISEHSRPNICRRRSGFATAAPMRGLPMTQDPKLNSHSSELYLACIAAKKAGADEV